MHNSYSTNNIIYVATQLRTYLHTNDCNVNINSQFQFSIQLASYNNSKVSETLNLCSPVATTSLVTTIKFNSSKSSLKCLES